MYIKRKSSYFYFISGNGGDLLDKAQGVYTMLSE